MYTHLPGATLFKTTPEVVKPLAAIALELSKLSSYTGRLGSPVRDLSKKLDHESPEIQERI